MAEGLSKQQKAEVIASELGLANRGKASFVELCKYGCNPSFLAEHFYFVTQNSTYTITPKNKKRKAYQVSLRSIDSLDSALGGIEKRQIVALQKKIKEVVEVIIKLNSSQLIRYIDPEELAPYVGISDLPSLLTYYADSFIPFILEKSKEAGHKQRPLFNLYMNSICSHVKERTKRARFGLICDVLNELGIDWDEGSLKQWYARHKEESKETM